MKNTFRFLMAALLVSLWATAQAQCIGMNAPGPPRIWDGARGCYVVQGTPALGAVYNGVPIQQYGVPQVVNQPYYGGMPQQYYGSPVAGGFSTPTVVGGILGGTIGSLAKHHTGQAVVGGAILGGVIGSMFGGQRVIAQPVMQQPMVASAPMVQTMAQPMIVQQPVAQPVVVQQPQQMVVAQPAPVAPGGSGTFCNIDGVVTREVDGAACEAKAAEKAKTLVSGTSLNVKHQDQAPTCAQGKTWTKLNWPGHPQHNTFVCLPDGDPHHY